VSDTERVEDAAANGTGREDAPGRSDRSDPSDDTDRSGGSGPARLLGALDVPRNAVVGAGVGVVLAAVLYFVRVLELFGPFAGTREFPVLGPEGWFLLLAFVLATTTAMIVAAVLTVLSAISLLRDA
jgi:hypothetical protein